MDNTHLQTAKFLLNNREVAKMLATAIDTALESLDAYIQREIDRHIEVCKANHQTGLETGLFMLKAYWKDKYNVEISSVAGVSTYNPHGCEGEQVYKFIQEFTSTSLDINNLTENYTQAEFNSLTEEDDNSEEVYNERAYHEFTASGGCLD